MGNKGHEGVREILEGNKYGKCYFHLKINIIILT